MENFRPPARLQEPYHPVDDYLNLSIMKRMKWEFAKITPTEQGRASQAAMSYHAQEMRRKWIVTDFNVFYESLACDELDETVVFLNLLDFGHRIATFDIHPSLIEMRVPYGVRRMFYEECSFIGDLIHGALNSQDKYFSMWKEAMEERELSPTDKATLARALWRWYYSVFEPISSRFKYIGQEHVGNIK